ncbi:hypothetical protein CIK05_11850 [Bdellovibrio sp. qaytius]|nr:hypothetical protein CIK05_11850 [Bdellovibrio sp. qaytius]
MQNQAELIVKESRNGTFNISNFGCTIGGERGDQPFRMIVQKNDGTEIARFENLLAIDLGVKTLGIDYQRDRYSISKFFSWSVDGQHLEGKSANARALLTNLPRKQQPVNLTSVKRTQMATSKTDWPTWDQPDDKQMHEALKGITPFIQFIHPNVIEQVVAHNSKIANLVTQMADQGIPVDRYFWDQSPCLFPGIRRFVGQSDDIYKRKVVPASGRAEFQAIYIDDNSYPKELWSYICRGTKFQKKNPEGYEFAHFFIHKAESEIGIQHELLGAEKYNSTISGFFTSAAGSAYIPKSLARVTDLNLKARKLIQLKCVEIYGSVCKVLPPGVELKIESDDWKTADFEWAKFTGESVDSRVQDFLRFRESELERLVLSMAKAG